MSKFKKYGNSSYWLKDWEDDDIIVNQMNDVERKSHDLYKLAASKRAISNFVNIVTNQQIPVKFNTRGDSYTDGTTVVIGSQIVEPKDFDVAVGLALHEGSHIKLSDFKVLGEIYNLVPSHIKDGAIKKGVNNPISIIKDIWNVVEDRRIDYYVFTSAPGYRDYYRSMYDKYFNDPLIDKGLNSDEFTESTVDSYMFRIINIHNKNTNLNALPGFNEIYKTIGLGTINRLKSTLDTFNVAMDVFKIILANLPSLSDGEGDGNGGQGDSDENQNGNGNGSSDESREMSDSEFDDLMDSLDGSSPMSGDMDSKPTGGSSMEIEMPEDVEGGEPTESTEGGKESNKLTLTDRQKELLKKKIEKQKEFMKGEIRKKAISRSEAQNVNAIEESGSEITSVGAGVDDGWGNVRKGTQCIVVKKLTKSLFENQMFPMTENNWYKTEESGVVRMYYENEVQNGIRIGTILGKKLQVRGEDRSTVFNRQKNGSIDKRMISSLGFGNENVFQYMETDSYKKANLHISIDASGSMGGSKWANTLTNVVALCKAVDMIQNLSIQVSFRTTYGNSPYVVMAYDSRVDKFSKVKQMFPALRAGGTTPEGLCFEAIMKNFLGSNNDMDSYFLNISDGEPYFYGNSYQYSGQPAFEHTRKMVKQIEGMGIKTLSYFVDEWSNSSEPSAGFKRMYGKGAKKIDVTNVAQITKTMNELFLTK
tara:strand:- start:3099 stop:5210 length:2112 start_codon:yes stop_codon:yes gene_type:complete